MWHCWTFCVRVHVIHGSCVRLSANFLEWNIRDGSHQSKITQSSCRLSKWSWPEGFHMCTHMRELKSISRLAWSWCTCPATVFKGSNCCVFASTKSTWLVLLPQHHIDNHVQFVFLFLFFFIGRTRCPGSVCMQDLSMHTHEAEGPRRQDATLRSGLIISRHQRGAVSTSTSLARNHGKDSLLRSLNWTGSSVVRCSALHDCSIRWSVGSLACRRRLRDIAR